MVPLRNYRLVVTDVRRPMDGSPTSAALSSWTTRLVSCPDTLPTAAGFHAEQTIENESTPKLMLGGRGDSIIRHPASAVHAVHTADALIRVRLLPHDHVHHRTSLEQPCCRISCHASPLC